MLQVKKLNSNAIIPTCSHPGEDLGFDLYSDEDIELKPNVVTKVHTGIAAQYVSDDAKYGLLVRDRSSMASKGIMASAGVIDHSYTGELLIMLTYISHWSDWPYPIKKGDKIAQVLPIEVKTGVEIVEVPELLNNTRGEKGFGSSGR